MPVWRSPGIVIVREARGGAWIRQSVQALCAGSPARAAALLSAVSRGAVTTWLVRPDRNFRLIMIKSLYFKCVAAVVFPF
jgi:hypothetical protein